MDGKGYNIIISRNNIANKIINNAISSNKIDVDNLTIDKIIESQQGSFNHRHNSLEFRIKRAKRINKNIPFKRIHSKIDILTIIIQLLRLKIRRKSLLIWNKTSSSITSSCIFFQL